jgi:ATP-dependent helicase/DNAse subunit B
MESYSALWVSFSSMRDFLACPRAYFLRNVYKDPSTGKKMSLISPPLALGQAVHEVVESLSVIPTEKRFSVSLRERLEQAWKKVAGEKGGFTDEKTEREYYERGLEMLKRVEEHPGPVKNLAVKINQDLPHYWLSKDDSIILCGKLDWLEYFPDTDSVHIVDFKTGKHEEAQDSMQLPIYYLLASHCQKRPVSKMSYWYLTKADSPQEQALPEAESAEKSILTLAKKIQLQRKLNSLKCPTQGCRACIPYEKLLAGEGVRVGTNDFGQDLYRLKTESIEAEESTIL